MRARLATVRQLRSVTGWSWWRCALFTHYNGGHMARASATALEGLRERDGR